MNNLKQAQLNHDSQLPPDTTEQDELIQSLAEALVEYGVVDTPNMLNYVYLDDLEVWMKNAEYKSIRIQSKINSYKELQLDLCECMMSELIKNEGE